MKKIFKITIIACAILFISSCSKDDPAADPSAQVTLNVQNIQKYSPYRVVNFTATSYINGSSYSLSEISTQATLQFRSVEFRFTSSANGSVTDGSSLEFFTYGIIGRDLLFDFNNANIGQQEYYDVTLNGLGQMSFEIEGQNINMPDGSTALVIGTMNLD